MTSWRVFTVLNVMPFESVFFSFFFLFKQTACGGRTYDTQRLQGALLWLWIVPLFLCGTVACKTYNIWTAQAFIILLMNFTLVWPLFKVPVHKHMRPLIEKASLSCWTVISFLMEFFWHFAAEFLNRICGLTGNSRSRLDR